MFPASSASSSSSSRRHCLSVLAKRRSTGDADRSAVRCRRSPRPLDEIAPSVAPPSWPVNAATRLHEGGAAAAGLGLPRRHQHQHAHPRRARGAAASQARRRRGPGVRSGTVAATATASGCSTSSRPRGVGGVRMASARGTVLLLCRRPHNRYSADRRLMRAHSGCGLATTGKAVIGSA